MKRLERVAAAWVLGATLATSVMAAPPLTPREQLFMGEQRYGEGSIPSALDYYEQAVKGGNTLAMVRIGEIHRFAEDYAGARSWYEKGWKAGNPAGAYMLGLVYAQGLGVPRDAAKAVEYLQAAAQGGWWEAHDFLARVYKVGDLGLPQDEVKFREHQTQAKALRDSYITDVEAVRKAMEARQKTTPPAGAASAP